MENTGVEQGIDKQDQVQAETSSEETSTAETKAELTPEEKKLKQTEMSLQNRAFYMMLEVLGIFIVPLIIVFGFRSMFDWTRTIMLIALGITFVISWIIVIIRVQNLGKQLRSIREQRTELAKSLNKTLGKTIETKPIDEQEND